MRVLEHFLDFVHVENFKMIVRMFQISNKNVNSTGFLNNVKIYNIECCIDDIIL